MRTDQTGPVTPDQTTEQLPDPAPDGGRRRARTWRYAGAAALLLLSLAAAVLALQLRSAAQDQAARAAALSAARQSALELTSISQEGFEDDVAAILDGATGEFRTDFAARADDLEQVVTENEVEAEGRVVESALVEFDRSSATALVVVDSTVRNRETPDGRVVGYRMTLELEKVDDRWLTSALEVSQP